MSQPPIETSTLSKRVKRPRQISCALVGNPNSGKTCIFNMLTGSRQRVGNYPGVTVAIKEGITRVEDFELILVDFPGTYSLAAHSLEEMIVQSYLIDKKPNVVINVVDATNLERNLYLTSQLIELGLNTVVALNMSDEARNQGITIDHEKLGQLLGVPFVPTVGNRGTGTAELLKMSLEVAAGTSPIQHDVAVNYGEDFEQEIIHVQQAVSSAKDLVSRYGSRWLAIQLLEKDTTIEDVVASNPHGEEILRARDKSVERLESRHQDDPSSLFSERRYGFVRGAVRETVSLSMQQKMRLSDTIDAVVTHRWFGIPIFILFFYLMFKATFTLGAIPMEWIGGAVGLIAEFVSNLLPEGILKGLIVEGVINGVGSVIVFLPNILVLFFFISLLEDTGYMARAAFIMDRVMHTLGLHGKSFIPLVMGFGCNVPAIMATRMLENRSDRMLTILINPLMSCSARLPVYILLAGTFFHAHATWVILGVYGLGVFLAMIVGQIFRRTLFRGDAAPFVMELPPYRVPLLRSVLIHMWDRAYIFIRKVGGVILIASILIWVLCSFPRQYPGSAEMKERIEAASQGVLTSADRAELNRLKVQYEEMRLQHSYAGRLGSFVEPALSPMGLDWKAGLALVTGVAAKETVVSTLGVLYQAGEGVDARDKGLQAALRKSGLKPSAALAFMVIVLIYVPCFGTIAVMRRETGSWKWTVFAVGYAFVLAWVVAFAVYHGANLFLSSGIV